MRRAERIRKQVARGRIVAVHQNALADFTDGFRGLVAWAKAGAHTIRLDKDESGRRGAYVVSRIIPGHGRKDTDLPPIEIERVQLLIGKGSTHKAIAIWLLSYLEDNNWDYNKICVPNRTVALKL